MGPEGSHHVDQARDTSEAVSGGLGREMEENAGGAGKGMRMGGITLRETVETRKQDVAAEPKGGRGKI